MRCHPDDPSARSKTSSDTMASFSHGTEIEGDLQKRLLLPPRAADAALSGSGGPSRRRGVGGVRRVRNNESGGVPSPTLTRGARWRLASALLLPRLPVLLIFPALLFVVSFTSCLGARAQGAETLPMSTFFPWFLLYQITRCYYENKITVYLSGGFNAFRITPLTKLLP